MVELYEHANYAGRKHIVIENVWDLNTEGFGDVVSSVRVLQGPNYEMGVSVKLSRDAVPQDEADLRGGYIELLPGDYPDIQGTHGFGDVCSAAIIFGDRRR